MHELVWQDARWRSRVRLALLKWFAKSARTLPWRTDPAPYRVWISEIMLQQTQVATVLPYFERFVERFPDVASLAAVDEATLMTFWEGLGYYRRARLMHAAAAKIVDQYDGRFPTDFDDVLALPGIGRYTAGAILSISGDQRLPILEGNTVRVFSRWIAMRSPVTEKASNAVLWQVAEAMLPPASTAGASGRAGTFNQAAMELGALVCTPKTPGCDVCPVAKMCRAHQLGIEAEVPGKVTSISYESRTEFALVIRSADRYWVRPLPAGSRWAGLWDFPRTTERSLDSVQQAAAELSPLIGATLVAGPRIMSIKHAVTKYRIRLDVHEATLDGDDAEPESPWRLMTIEEMSGLPMSVTGRQIVERLARSDGG